MAEFLRYTLSINLKDGIGRPCGNTYYVSSAVAAEYISAADDAARAASDVGVFVAAYLGMTDAAFVSTNVGIEVVNDPVSNVADTILRGNKLDFLYSHAGRKDHFAIPCRKAAAFTQIAESLEVSISAPTAMTNFLAAYSTTILDAYGNDATVREAKLVD